MHKDNLNPIIKTLNNFYKKEEYKIFKEYVKDWENKKTFFEIWAAPWFYWAIFKKYFSYIPWWIEYTNNWFNCIKELFKNLNYESNNFIKWDFLKINKDKKYDIVFSAWFIEHFKNYEIIIKKHIDILKKWWKVIIIIPNYHYYFKFFQEFLYKWLMKEQHVTEIMNLKKFEFICKKIALKNKIKIHTISWFWNARFWQLVSKNKWIQKIIYWLDLLFEKTKLYNLLPKDYSSLIFIWEKL